MHKRNNNPKTAILIDKIRNDELADLFCVSQRTVSNWLATGKLKSREVKEVVIFYHKRLIIKKRNFTKTDVNRQKVKAQ